MAYCVAPVLEEIASPQQARRRIPFDLFGSLFFTALGFLVMGYHPGLEDDGIYLTAVTADLNPALFPYNTSFFRLQMQATVFDRWMTLFVRFTHMPLSWAELFWQLDALFLILYAVKKIANRLFAEDHARWGGVALVAAMFTLPVAGTALCMVDQHLHPRTLATALILLAVWRILDAKKWQAVPLLLAAFLMHPIMAIMGVSFCTALKLTITEAVQARARNWRTSIAAAAVPLGWIFEPENPGWRQALTTRRYDFLYKWTWYEWLGALAPLLFFWFVWQFARARRQVVLARFAMAALIYGAFQQTLAMTLLGPNSLARLAPLQPMRYLHLLYFFLALTTGCLLAKFTLKRSVWRWVAFLLIANGSMFAAQRAEFASSQHLEVPWRRPTNPWIEAFAWVRGNTPQNAYFALDPRYLAARGEDYHCFQALADRSSLADAVKDASVVTMVPELGPEWVRQTEATQAWSNFGLGDFERLKKEFGIDWVLVTNPAPSGLACRWHNAGLAVCQIP